MEKEVEKKKETNSASLLGCLIHAVLVIISLAAALEGLVIINWMMRTDFYSFFSHYPLSLGVTALLVISAALSIPCIKFIWKST